MRVAVLICFGQAFGPAGAKQGCVVPYCMPRELCNDGSSLHRIRLVDSGSLKEIWTGQTSSYCPAHRVVRALEEQRDTNIISAAKAHATGRAAAALGYRWACGSRVRRPAPNALASPSPGQRAFTTLDFLCRPHSRNALLLLLLLLLSPPPVDVAVQLGASRDPRLTSSSACERP